MPEIRFAERSYSLCEGESVLDCLLGHGVTIPFSCRAGVCQTCLMQAVDGIPPQTAQQGLKPSLRAGRHFLACVCRPEEDLAVALPGTGVARTEATVVRMELLNPEVMSVGLDTRGPVDYRAGQFINLFREPGVGRSYSLASVPDRDRHLEIHVRRLPGGSVSGWIHNQLRPGHEVCIQGPGGDCFYVPGKPDQGLLLIGTGTGLAPLYGIVRDALGRGHRGPIRLFHGSRDRSGLYLVEELRALARAHSNFDYTPCLSGVEPPAGFAPGRAHEVALREMPELNGWAVYLCGHPDMVKAAQRQTFLAGANLDEIFSDAFTLTPAASAAA